MTWVDTALNKAFFHLGRLVGKHPGYFIVVPILLSGLCATGYQRMRYEIDPEYLFSPVNGEGKAERAVVEEFFKPNYTSRFNVGRITRPGKLQFLKSYKECCSGRFSLLVIPLIFILNNLIEINEVGLV